MKFVVLGSGASFPQARRSSSGYWLKTENGSILLDCAASVPHRMAQENLPWAELDTIWISHFHLDHIGGLAPFLFGLKHAPETRNRTKPLRVLGAKGLRALIQKLDDANDYKLFKQNFPVEITEVEPLEKFEILPETEAIAFDTPHTDESLAIRIKDKNEKTIVYSADTGFTKTLGTFAQNADLLVLECSFFRDKPIETHLELSEAMYLIRYAQPKKVVLTHLYPEWNAVDFEAEAKKFSPPCEVIESRDGLSLEI